MESEQKHSVGMYMLGVTALFHNFCFWGVVSFFPLYLTGEYQYSEGDAPQAYGVFLGTATALPLLGGYVSFYLRRYSISILLGFLFVVLGCLMLSLNTESLLLLSLAFVSLGYGVFWPSVLALLGKSYGSRESLRDEGFTIFYAVSTGGVLLTQTLSSLIVEAHGWTPLYLTLAVAGLLGIASFILSYRNYRSIDSATAQLISNPDNPAHNPLTTADRKRLTAILILTVFSIVFWMGCTQMGSSVVFFAKNFVNRRLLTVDVPPSVFLSFFALSVVILGPVMAALWRFLRKRKVQISAPRQMAISLTLLALSFAVICMAEMDLVLAGSKRLVNPIYLTGFYFLQACAVIIMGPIGFAFVTKWAPNGWIGRLTGLWYFGIGLGSLLGGYANNVVPNVMSPLYNYELWFLLLFCAAVGLFSMNHYIMKMLRH